MLLHGRKGPYGSRKTVTGVQTEGRPYDGKLVYGPTRDAGVAIVKVIADERHSSTGRTFGEPLGGQIPRDATERSGSNPRLAVVGVRLKPRARSSRVKHAAFEREPWVAPAALGRITWD